ncbi:bifunctional DNA-formamidopyrimidine glycosylase/DNA-(apurinic or apyrimidinic site) lyase [Mycetocola tolaasinivorans]|uniref:Bifunctional DNA-formamidopyrimidine glycosylase/DNA-(Apurinic or apyrimidinic site) lyase n=1 Tax=Mycetocola tolaasinivorans TaxID=76635 RepID=A0A3L6ZWC8_9MICO|nr:bifunctional DNA-formamidopyrimidine glycosylase/DNA-(apurinic or apyrimidinic site) lyase [Mycetocola tolaasinivorans]RLP71881.1 bifunctional DNA-formamidopyrimidine glycosylase/DNA-(apurinic or apyrimidinic site) lyase [Mycetocola tolaasinivorans]
MPELPEVEVVRAGLEPAVSGAIITGVEVLDQRALKRHDPIRGDFAALLTGSRLSGAVRRGKYLWFPVAEGPAAGDVLAAHLGMSGQMLLREPGRDDKLTRIRLSLEHPEHGELWLNFVDQRLFGGMMIDSLVPTPDALPAGFGGAFEPGALIPRTAAHIARDPLDPHFDDRAFFAGLARRRTGIKRALLDQTLISGIGNIYADEALWAARLHYDRESAGIPQTRRRDLLEQVRGVLRRALVEGGTSFDAQYVNVNGNSGYFAHSLNAYGQQGKACPRCGGEIVRESFMNRGSHFCPRCQRAR